MFFFYTEYEAYSFKPLVGPTSMVEPFKKEGVRIDAVVYSSSDSQHYLQRDLIADDVQPVQITIQNNTPRSFSLGTEGIPADLSTASAISNKMLIQALPRSIGLKVASFFFWPFIIPGTIDTIVTTRSYVKMKKDFAAKTVKEENETILPYSTVHRILFMRDSELADNFVIYLKDHKTSLYKPFPVVINS